MNEQKPHRLKTQWWQLEPEDFYHLDIVSEIERLAEVSLSQQGKTWHGRCPYHREHGCTSKDDGFKVWPDITQTKANIHFWCRKCERSGNIVKLLMDLRDMKMYEVCELLEIGSPDVAKRPKVQRKESADEKREREWKEAQLNWLHKYNLAFRRYALSNARAQAYFAQRGIPLEIVEELEICYIPPFKDAEQARQDKEKWSMRYWTDRILFPLPDGGFTGRALYLWEPGMDEEKHKELLNAFNAKVQAHNEKMVALYGKEEGRKRSKGLIPRYKTISPQNKFFHEQVLETSDHATFVEGPFDVCACYAAGVKDAIAVGTNKIDAKYIPARICDVTIALDGDESGIETAASWSKLLRRKGIAVRNVTIPADDRGKDWSERFRLHGIEGMAPLLEEPHEEPEPEPEPEIFVEQELCGPCFDNGVETPAILFYESIGRCEEHARALGLPLERMSRERFRATALIAAAEWPGGCEVHEDPPGFTIEDSARVTSGQLRMCERAAETQCMFMTLVEVRDKNAWLRKGQRCARLATHNGWCEEHKLSDEFLQLGMRLYYREVRLHESRSVAPGVRNWEAYAMLVSKERLQGDIALLKAMIEHNIPAGRAKSA